MSETQLWRKFLIKKGIENFDHCVLCIGISKRMMLLKDGIE